LEFLKTCNGYITQSIIIEINKFHDRIQRLALLAYCIPPASFCVCFISLIAIQASIYQNGFIRIYIAGSGVLAVVSGLMISYAFRFVLKHLQGHVNNFDQTSNEIQAVYALLRRNYYVCAATTGTFGVICLATGTSSYLWDRSYYVFIFFRILIPILSYILTMKASLNLRTNRRSTLILHLRNISTPNGASIDAYDSIFRGNAAHVYTYA
jgi:hypothetical protein